MTKQTINIPIEKLHPFKDHPFKVADDGEMLQLMRSIRENGLLTPISVRPIDNDEYEVISVTGDYTHAKRQDTARFLP